MWIISFHFMMVSTTILTHNFEHVHSSLLCPGQLHLELDKATYERCGLVGKVIPDHGRKHVKSRYGKVPVNFSCLYFD